MLKSGQNITALFTVSNPTSGAAVNADSLPTGILYINGTANGATVTVTNITTGVYKAAVNLPSLIAGDVVEIRITGAVSSVTGEGVIFSDIADTKRVSDLQDLTAAQVNAECDTAVADAALATANEQSLQSSVLDELIKSAVNRHRVDRDNNKFYIYANDNTTVHREFDCVFDDDTGELIDLVPVLS